MTTGQWAWWAHRWLTDPMTSSSNPPSPRDPRTSSSAPALASTRALPGGGPAVGPTTSTSAGSRPERIRIRRREKMARIDQYTHDGLTFDVTDRGRPTAGRHPPARLPGGPALLGPPGRVARRGRVPALARPARYSPRARPPAAGLRARPAGGDVLALADAAGRGPLRPRRPRLGCGGGVVPGRAPAPDAGADPDGPVGPAPSGLRRRPCVAAPSRCTRGTCWLFQVPEAAGASPARDGPGGERFAGAAAAHRPRRANRPAATPAGPPAGAMTGPLNWYRAVPFDRATRSGRSTCRRCSSGATGIGFVTRAAGGGLPPAHVTGPLPVRRPAGGRRTGCRPAAGEIDAARGSTTPGGRPGVSGAGIEQARRRDRPGRATACPLTARP